MFIRFSICISLFWGASTAQLTWDSCADLKNSDFEVTRVLDLEGRPNLNKPLRLAIDETGIIYVSDYKSGSVFRVDPAENYREEEIGNIPITEDQWHGINGMALPPDFAETKHLYTITAQGDMGEGLAGSPDRFRLSRFTLKGNQLDLAGEKIILEWGIDTRDAHHGGDLDFDAEGNLYFSTGNDAYAHWQYLPNKDEYSYPRGAYPTILDERNILFNAMKSSGNTNDLRGKIIKIKPIELSESHPRQEWGIDKTYTIPEGNMFPVGTPRTRPEIFSMGMRNPYGIHVEPNGTVYIADVGPENVPPEGGDQLFITDEPKNFGHPMFVNGNAYEDWDFVNNTGLGYFDPDYPVNNSKFNTGLDTLPPVTHPSAYKSHLQSINEDNGWGFVTSGRMSLFAGPVYWYNGNNPSTTKFPPHFNGKWIFFENAEPETYHAATVGDELEIIDIVEIFKDLEIPRPVDMEFGPDGNLYVLAHKQGAGIYRVDYTGGCHPATPVEVVHHPANVSGNDMQKLMLGSTRFIPVPENAVQVKIFTMQGRLIYTSLILGRREIKIRGNLYKGMGLLKFYF